VEPRLDHVLTYAAASSIDEHLDTYRAAGFHVARVTARHRGGVRNGFVNFGPEYLECVWVEDEAAFAAGHPRMPALTDSELRGAARPFGMGFLVEDVPALHEAWTVRGHALPPPFHERPPGAPADAPPALTLQAIPAELLPGALCFALTYHFDAKPTNVIVPPNTVYGMAGVTFVSDRPEARARRCRDVLAPGAPLEAGGTAFALGPHRLRWLTPGQFEAALGRAWVPPPHGRTEIAAIDVLAERLDRAEDLIGRAGRPVVRLERGSETRLVVGPGPRDGVVLAVRERPAAAWAAERGLALGRV
jgi:hypothetical protein